MSLAAMFLALAVGTTAPTSQPAIVGPDGKDAGSYFGDRLMNETNQLIDHRRAEYEAWTKPTM